MHDDEEASAAKGFSQFRRCPDSFLAFIPAIPRVFFAAILLQLMALC
jgi:hypothetical protein